MVAMCAEETSPPHPWPERHYSPLPKNRGARSTPLLAEWRLPSTKPYLKTLLEFTPFSTTELPSTPRVAGETKGWTFVLIPFQHNKFLLIQA